MIHVHFWRRDRLAGNGKVLPQHPQAVARSVRARELQQADEYPAIDKPLNHASGAAVQPREAVGIGTVMIDSCCHNQLFIG
jgi:hypothetical protein